MYSFIAQRYPTSAMRAHQATVRRALLPIAVPRSSPRIVSMKGVKGWYSANQTKAGRHRVGGDEAASEERQEQKGHG